MAEAEFIGVYGRRGSGKSTRAKAIIATHKRVIVFDTLGEYARELGYTKCTTVGDVREAMIAGWKTGYRIAFVPGSDLAGKFHALSDFIWQARARYEGRRQADLLTVVVEEANLAIPNNKLGAGRDAALRLALQGRHRGIGGILVSQRPALVNADIRTQCTQVYFFGLTDPLDVQAVDRLCGRGYGAKAQQLAPHSCLIWRDGAVVTGKNNIPHKVKK